MPWEHQPASKWCTTCEWTWQYELGNIWCTKKLHAAEINRYYTSLAICTILSEWSEGGQPLGQRITRPRKSNNLALRKDEMCSWRGWFELGNKWCTKGILLQVGMGCFIGLFGAYSLIPPTTCPCGTCTCLHWSQSRTPGSLTLGSVTTKHISLQWACNKLCPW